MGIDNLEEMAGGMVSLNIPVGDVPEAEALLAPVASAAVSTSSSVSKSGFSEAADDENVSHRLEGNVESQEPGASGSGTSDKDNDVEGKLFVGGISWQTTEDGLRHYFSQYGTLMNVTIMKDKYTGHPRGFGFIKFDDVTVLRDPKENRTRTECLAAYFKSVLDKILAQEHKIDGKVVDVKRAVPKNEALAPAPRINKPPDSYKIFVGGLAPTVLMADVKKYFEKFGAVADAVVMFDRQTQRSRGFGFVTFREESIIRVIMKSAHEIKGKMVEVKRAEPKESRTNRANRDDKPCGPYPEKESPERAPFLSARRVQPSPGRVTGACYRMENSFANGNSNCAFHFVGVDAATYSQMPYAYPGYGYNAQVYAAPTYCSGGGTGGTYGMEGISFPGIMPMHSRYSQSDYAVALRNQQYAQHYAQAPQRVNNVGVGVYFAQPY